MMRDREIFNVGNNIELSVISGEGTYSDANSVEIAILQNGEFRYDLSGGDVISYFPRTYLNDFVSFVSGEIEKNPNLSDVNLVQDFGKTLV